MSTDTLVESHKLLPNIGTLQQTLFLPCWGRARFGEIYSDFNDPWAKAAVARVDFDFAAIERRIGGYGSLCWGYRAYRIDQMVRAILKKRPDAQIVNLGAGLDTVFERVDNGHCSGLSVDFADTIQLRRRLYPEIERHRHCSDSITSGHWYKELARDRPIIAVMSGVTMYLKEHEVKKVVSILAQHPAGVDLVFDTVSPLAVKLSNMQIKRSTLPEALFEWGLADPKIFEHWCPTAHVISRSFIFSGLKIPRGTTLYTRSLLWLSWFLNFSSLIHLRMPPPNARG